MIKMYESRTLKACKAWLGLYDSGVSLKDTTIEDAVESFRKLVEVAEGYENLCNTEEEYIRSLLKTIVEKGDIIENLRKDLALEEYKNKILREMVDENDVIITNLRKDLDGMGRKVDTLRELNNNQAMIIANNRTKRKDF